MTQADWSKSERLPRRSWHALCTAANTTFATHVDSDPLETMHHLIGADVLLKSNSGYSDVAAAYSAGLKLFFVPSRELALSSFGPLEPSAAFPSREWGYGLRDPSTRREFVCALLAHMRFRAAHDGEPPPQAIRLAAATPAASTAGHTQPRSATAKGHRSQSLLGR